MSKYLKELERTLLLFTRDELLKLYDIPEEPVMRGIIVSIAEILDMDVNEELIQRVYDDIGYEHGDFLMLSNASLKEKRKRKYGEFSGSEEDEEKSKKKRRRKNKRKKKKVRKYKSDDEDTEPEPEDRQRDERAFPPPMLPSPALPREHVNRVNREMRDRIAHQRTGVVTSHPPTPRRPAPRRPEGRSYQDAFHVEARPPTNFIHPEFPQEEEVRRENDIPDNSGNGESPNTKIRLSWIALFFVAGFLILFYVYSMNKWAGTDKRTILCESPDCLSCTSGWTGRDCNTPVWNSECGSHGTFTSPGNCQCAFGWADGKNPCDTPVCISRDTPDYSIITIDGCFDFFRRGNEIEIPALPKSRNSRQCPCDDILYHKSLGYEEKRMKFRECVMKVMYIKEREELKAKEDKIREESKERFRETKEKKKRVTKPSLVQKVKFKLGAWAVHLFGIFASNSTHMETGGSVNRGTYNPLKGFLYNAKK